MAKPKEKTEALYLNIVIEKNGSSSFGKYCKEPTEKSSEIITENSTGQKFCKHYELYSEIQGKLTQVMTYDSELKQDVTVEKLSLSVLNNDGKKENVQVNFNTNFSASMIKRLEKIDLTKEVLLKTFRIKDDEKSKAKGKEVYNELFMPYQLNPDGKWVAVENKYKLNSGFELPKFKETKKTVKKVEVTEWDKSDYEEALRTIVRNVNDDIKRVNVTEKVELKNEVETPEIDKDDLPF